MKHHLSQIQTQRQVLAPLMQQSVAILLLPIMDLDTTIDMELQTNPLLEIDEESEKFRKDEELFIKLDLLARKRGDSNRDESNITSDEEFPEEKPIIRDVTLEEELLRLLRIETKDELDIKIGEAIIGNLNEDGFLTASLDEIARQALTDDLERVDRILKLIQGFGPLGIASLNLQECLLIQLKAINNNGNIASRMIKECLEDLGRKRYNDIARKLEAPLKEVTRLAQVISTLDPKPARNFRPIKQEIYIKPDVYVTRDQEGALLITVNHVSIPQLRINKFYKDMLLRPNLSEEERSFIHQKLENAINFIKSIEQRGQTLKAVTQLIVEKQKSFFEGNLLDISPMTLKEVASVLERNESTISRAIHNKYIDTPYGLYPLKYFFSSSLETNSNGSSGKTSSRSIKEQIKDLIDEEDKTHPLSDQEIQKHFENKGVTLARRTINKYREALEIPPSHLRKKLS